MAEERVRADVLADPNIRAVMDAFPVPSSKPIQQEAADMPELPDFESIMQMAQNAQNELQKAQDNLDKIEVEGAAGGGMVKVRATAKGRILAVDIDESLLAPSEKTMVEDLSLQRSTTRAAKRTRPRPEKCRRCSRACRCRQGSSCLSKRLRAADFAA